jgi:hypothetical protein
MTLFRRILTGAALAVTAAGLASADNIISYTVTTSSNPTDITNLQVLLTSWCPGCTATAQDGVGSMAEPGSYVGAPSVTATGVTMASLNAPGTIYTLQGFDIRVVSAITGTYTVSNSVDASTASGTAHVDSYTAVALGSTLSPGLTNLVDPTNDIFNDGAVPGLGPDPASTAISVNLAPGTNTSGSFTNVKQAADFGCVVTLSFTAACQSYDKVTNPQLTFQSVPVNVASTDPLTFYLSTATEVDSALSGGNTSTQNSTSVVEQITVTYDYTTSSTAPEPTTMALMGGALLGLGLLGKRFKKS